MVRDKKAMNHVYRQMIATEIQGDPIKYRTDVLEGKTNEEYVTWIMNVDKWGGEIEMSILAKHLGVEVAASKYLPAPISLWVCSQYTCMLTLTLTPNSNPCMSSILHELSIVTSQSYTLVHSHTLSLLLLPSSLEPTL